MIKHRRNYQDAGVSFIVLIKNCFLFGLIFSIIFALISLFIAVIMFNTNNPTPKIEISSALALYISSLIVGFAIAKKLPSKKLLGGTLTGVLIMCIILVISAVTKGEQNIFRYFIPAFSFLGSVIGTKEATQKRRRFKKNH